MKYTHVATTPKLKSQMKHSRTREQHLITVPRLTRFTSFYFVAYKKFISFPSALKFHIVAAGFMKQSVTLLFMPEIKISSLRGAEDPNGTFRTRWGMEDKKRWAKTEIPGGRGTGENQLRNLNILFGTMFDVKWCGRNAVDLKTISQVKKLVYVNRSWIALPIRKRRYAVLPVETRGTSGRGEWNGKAAERLLSARICDARGNVRVNNSRSSSAPFFSVMGLRSDRHGGFKFIEYLRRLVSDTLSREIVSII